MLPYVDGGRFEKVLFLGQFICVRKFNKKIKKNHFGKLMYWAHLTHLGGIPDTTGMLA